MAKRQREWAKRKRIELSFLLGGRCFKCGTENKLEFDCVEPRGDWHHKIASCWRISFYWKQYREKNLQLLYSKCHNKKSGNEQLWLEEQPF